MRILSVLLGSGFIAFVPLARMSEPTYTSIAYEVPMSEFIVDTHYPDRTCSGAYVSILLGQDAPRFYLFRAMTVGPTNLSLA